MGSSRGVVAAVAALALITAGCATTVAGRAVPAPGALAPPAASRTATPAPQVVPTVVDPVVPGWRVARSTSRAALYDVPPDWQVYNEDTVIGFAEPSGDPRVASSGAAQFGTDVCGPNSSVATAVLRHDTGTDLAAASRNNAGAWVDAAYRGDDDEEAKLTAHAPEQTTLLDGTQAVIVQVDATLAKPVGQCGITRGTGYAVAANLGPDRELGPTVVLVVLTDVGVPQEVPAEVIRRILSTLRPSGG